MRPAWQLYRALAIVALILLLLILFLPSPLH